MFIALVLILVLTVGITVGISSLKDITQDPIKFNGRCDKIVAFSILNGLVVLALLARFLWQPHAIPTQPFQAEAPALSPTAVATIAPIVATADEEKDFGGVMIKNPEGKVFSVEIYNLETLKYEEYQEATDVSELYIEAEDESYFRGRILVGIGEKFFEYDPKKDLPVKKIKI